MLKVRRIPIDTLGENVVFLSSACAAYRPESFRALNKVIVKDGGREILATVNIVEDGTMVAPDELGLSVTAFNDLNVTEGDMVELEHTAPPDSLEHVRRKIHGETLSESDLQAIIRDIAGHRYSRMEITAFLMACASFMTTDEVIGLTRAMADIGTRLDWDMEMVVDKHCIGGLPGNRTSMIVVPIVAAYGLPIPKTSSRAITSPAGTADTMEVLANVDVPVDRMIDMVRDTKGCLVWGGHVNLSPADDILITVERPLSIDTQEQMVASILSKKVAAGSTHLLIDMPVGPTAKVRSREEAVRLRKLFEHVAQDIGLYVEIVLTDGRQPIGRGIGPVLEARDVMAVLKREPHAPADLRDRALLLAGHILEFDPALRGGQGFEKAKDILDSGAALEAMERIIHKQGPPKMAYTPGPLCHAVKAEAEGTVASIDCLRLARIARTAGAPMSKGSGLDLHVKIGDPVRRGDTLYTVHSALETDLDRAQRMAAADHGYAFG